MVLEPILMFVSHLSMLLIHLIAYRELIVQGARHSDWFVEAVSSIPETIVTNMNET